MTELKFSDLKKYFEYHYNNCALYRDYCDNTGFAPGDLYSWEDIAKIPLIPTGMFKKSKILSVSDERIIKRCTSSGTNGSISEVYRDHDTLAAISTKSEITMEKIQEDIHDYSFYIMGPAKEEAKDLWFAYVMSLLEDIPAEAKYFVKDGELKLEELAEQLHLDMGVDKKIIIIGPPMFFVFLAARLQDSPVRLQNGHTVTMGGWKSYKNRAVSREELEMLIHTSLGVSYDRILDAYSSVEINTVLIECNRKHMHVPDWLYVDIRDPDTLESVPYGQQGLISFIDTTAVSYPCMVLSEDFGILHAGNKCDCGNKSDYLQIIRRVETVEGKGCAIKMDDTVVKKEIKNEN